MSAYQVLYRKYRPKTFEDVVGQPQVTITLKNELKSGRVNHAYLFTGTRGTGKTSCAKILSKAVNCLSPREGEPCCECEICKGIDAGEIFDVIEMDAASNRRIDDIRDITDKISYTPERGKYRVFIIDEVHMLTTEAFNALLKTLEEPPEHVIFILATTEVHKLPATILSRCQRFDFHRINANDMAKRIKYVTESEGAEISDEAALLVAVIADGAVRDALSLLDRCLSLQSTVDADTVRRAAGLAQKDYLLDLANSCVNKNSERAISILNKLYSDSKDMSRLCDELINHYRSLMLIKTVRNPRELIVMSDGEFDTAVSQAERLTLSDIVYAMDILQSTYERMGKGSDNRIELEIALVKLSAPELESSMESLLARISALEKAVKCGIPSAPTTVVQNQQITAEKAEVTAKPSAPAETQTKTAVQEEPDISIKETSEDKPANTATTAKESNNPEKTKNEPTLSPAPAVEPMQKPKARTQADMDSIMSAATPLGSWPEVVANLKQYSRAIASSFEGTSAYVSGDYLLIDARTDIPFRLLQSSSQRDNLRKAVQEITGKRYILGPYKRPEAEVKETDPLDSLIDELRSSGVEVIEE
ncbi:MAG: DNA polymerase III subunit gamma/tau [Clostridia bacterium]|nr:DNA polymerase III subunit gamma/tau [Clostridia bacterium]